MSGDYLDSEYESKDTFRVIASNTLAFRQLNENVLGLWNLYKLKFRSIRKQFSSETIQPLHILFPCHFYIFPILWCDLHTLFSITNKKIHFLNSYKVLLPLQLLYWIESQWKNSSVAWRENNLFSPDIS